MAITMTRAEYEAKYGKAPASTPIKMTRAQYEAKYGLPVASRPFNPKNPNTQFVQPTPAGATKMQYRPEDKTGVAGKFVKELPGAAAKTVVGVPAKTAISLGEIAAHPVKTLKGEATGRTYNVPLVGPTKSIQSGAAELFPKIIEGQEPLYKALGPVAESVAGPVDTALTVTGGKSLVKAGQKGLSTVLAKASERRAATALKEVLEVVKPKLSAAEEAAAKASGRGTTKGLLRKVEVQPSERDLEIAKVAQEAGVRPGKAFDKNIAVMKQAQKQSAEAVRQGLKDSKAIWNKNELKGALNQVEPPISLTQPDLPIAAKLRAGILKLVDDAPKSPDGILDVRQGFDDLVEQNFGKKIFAKDDPKGILIRKYRQALNDFAESKLPDGKLRSGSTLKAELRRQHLLYDAIDNVAEKAPKAGTTGLGRFLQAHPTLKTAAKWTGITALGGGFLKSLGD